MPLTLPARSARPHYWLTIPKVRRLLAGHPHETELLKLAIDSSESGSDDSIAGATALERIMFDQALARLVHLDHDQDHRFHAGMEPSCPRTATQTSSGRVYVGWAPRNISQSYCVVK